MRLTRPFRKILWTLGSFFRKHRKLILSAGFLGVILFLLVKNLIPLLPKLKPSLRIGLVGQYNFNNLPQSVTQTISRGLTKIDATGTPQPDLAETWVINPAETVYLVYLKKNIFWADGTAITANNITLEIPNVAVKIIDDFTLQFQLQESYSPFLTILSRPLFKNKTISAGEFIIKSSRYIGSYLKALELVGPNANLFYRFYQSQEAAWLGFRLGEVNRLENLLINPLTGSWQNKVKLNTKANNHQYLALIFNFSDPYLINKSFRQALAYAIEKKSSLDTNRALSPISPDSWAYNSKVKPYDYNSTQAKELFSKFTKEATVSAALEISLGTSESFLPLAESIARSWEDVLGIKTKIKVVNSIEPDFQALLIAQEIPTDPDQHALWHSTQDTNIAHYSDLKIDKLLEDGRKISSLVKRKEIYLDFQKFLIEDSPAIFLEHPLVYTISR